MFGVTRTVKKEFAPRDSTLSIWKPTSFFSCFMGTNSRGPALIINYNRRFTSERKRIGRLGNKLSFSSKTGLKELILWSSDANKVVSNYVSL